MTIKLFSQDIGYKEQASRNLYVIHDFIQIIRLKFVCYTSFFGTSACIRQMQFTGFGVPQQAFCNEKVAVVYLISEILEKIFCFFVCLLDRERFTILVQQPLVFLWACFHWAVTYEASQRAFRI